MGYRYTSNGVGGFNRTWTSAKPRQAKTLTRCARCGGYFIALRDGYCVYNGCYKTVTNEG